MDCQRADQEKTGADMALDCIKDVPFSATTAWSLYASVSESGYMTQGFGSHRYARQSAESYADDARHAGLEVKIEETRHGAMGWGKGWSDFAVMVQGDEVDMEVLRRRPGLSLKDWLKSCWKRGVNPRVYNPYLPVGLENKLGLDYFGNEVKSCPSSA